MFSKQLIHKMENQAKQNLEVGNRNQSGKDILHKISKIQENRFLRAKDHNVNDLRVQKNKKQDLDFEFELVDQNGEDEEGFYIAEDLPLQTAFQDLPCKEINHQIFCFDDDDEDNENKGENGNNDHDQIVETNPFESPIKKRKQELVQSQNNQISKNARKQRMAKNEEKRKHEKDIFFMESDGEEETCKKTQVQIEHEKTKFRSQSEFNHKSETEQLESEIEKEGESEGESSLSQDIKGVRLEGNPLEGNINIIITDKQQLINSPLPSGIILKCLIRRSPNFFNPQFDIYLHNGMKHMISGKKFSLATNEPFKLYSEMNRFEEKFKIGSILTNTVHSLYWIIQDIESDHKSQRCLVKGLVNYRKMKKPMIRRMDVGVFEDEIELSKDELIYGGQSLVKGCESAKMGNLDTGKKENSIKNFVLVDIDENDGEYEYLKMTKTSQNMFELYIRHPLSPLQAFGIVLTRFDAELK